MKLKYIKSDGVCYFPQEAGVQNPEKIIGCFLPVCYIKQISKGRWQIDYYDDNLYAYDNHGDNQKPVSRKILYPAGIQEIQYCKD